MRDAETPLTFLFTDIVGSTSLWQRHGEVMADALAEHDLRVTKAMHRAGGEVFAGGGDGFGVVFAQPSAAIDAALDAQDALGGLAVGEEPMTVRIGIHTGSAQSRNGDYFGLSVNRCARLCSAANGGQTLVSGPTAGLIEERADLVHLGEFRLADLLEPLAVYQAGLGEFPPIKALDPSSNNLPLRFTSFVGRDDLVDHVSKGLSSQRLMTLTGPGGVGKTSLALEVGAQFASRQTNGVWLVRLDELEAGGEVVGQIADVLSLDRSPTWPQQVANRDLVLILDNAEHVIEQTADAVTELLEAGSALRILVTSREPLAVPGERVVEVPPLPILGSGTSLFLDRAGLDDTGDPSIESIVALTDGLPLAIELVAGHTHRMQLSELAQSLERHGLGHLRVRGSSPRHRSAMAAIGWSYELLDEEEQSALAALSLFSGAFSLAQGAAVAGTARPVLQSLAAKSLLQPSDRRYRLLTATRDFAAKKLEASDEWADARKRRAQLVAEEIEALSADLGPRDGEQWIGALTLPLADVLASMALATELRDFELLERLALAIPGPFGLRRDLMPDVFDILDPILPDLLMDIERWRWILLRYAWCGDISDREREARELVAQIRPVAVRLRDRELVGMCDLVRLRTGVNRGLFPDEEVDQLLRSAETNAAGSRWLKPLDIAWQRGAHAQARGELHIAERVYSDLIASGMMGVHNTAISRVRLAEVFMDQERPREALAHLERIEDDLPIAVDRDIQRVHAYIALGDTDRALQLLLSMVEPHNESMPPEAFLCPGADYFRAIDDHRPAVWMLARMLGDEPPGARVHHDVIDEGRRELGAAFEAEWNRGKRMSLEALRALLREA